ncbi:RNA polymerase sigma factor [Maribacter sp. 2308TA10-17]|uniref:RNA polymerase sigma factor n=1 Tax=Maribacter sp. 2308TA10-17 TaxID=3386276 RepID=UPI0039BCD9D4
MNTVIKKRILNPEAWVESYNDMFVTYTLNRVGHLETARDLVQDTFLAAFLAAPNYKGDAKESTWLIAILKRKIIDYYRKCNTRKGKAFMRAGEANRNQNYNWLEEKVANSACEDEITKLDSQVVNDIIHTTIENLPARQAQIIRLKTLGWKTNDICEELGINQSNLWVTLHRARKSLKFQLGSLMG